MRKEYDATQHAFGLLLGGTKSDDVIRRLSQNGLSLTVAREHMAKASVLLTESNRAAFGRDVIIGVVMLGIAIVGTVILSTLYPSPAAILPAVVGPLVGFVFFGRGVARPLGWRSQADRERGRSIVAKYETEAERKARGETEEKARTRIAKEQRVITTVLVALILLTFASLFLAK